jgi:hypothetical protein
MRLAHITLISFLAAASCTTIDEERQQMRSTIDASGALARDIQTWRASMAGDIPSTVVTQIQQFQARAEEQLSILNGLSNDATSGTDLMALKQALQTIEDFDTSRVENSSAASRTSLLDQFQGLATNLQSAIAKTRTR